MRILLTNWSLRFGGVWLIRSSFFIYIFWYISRVDDKYKYERSEFWLFGSSVQIISSTALRWLIGWMFMKHKPMICNILPWQVTSNSSLIETRWWNVFDIYTHCVRFVCALLYFSKPCLISNCWAILKKGPFSEAKRINTWINFQFNWN